MSGEGELSCLCINSWGEHDPTPCINLKTTKCIVYCINVLWVPVYPGTQEYSPSNLVMTLSENKYVKSVILIGIGVFGKVVNLTQC